MAIEIAYAPGWAPVVLTECGTAMCRLIEFRERFEALPLADRAAFAEELAELLGIACLAGAALDALAGR